MTYAWCFEHGRLHTFDDKPWCTTMWVKLVGTSIDEAMADKQARFGDRQFGDVTFYAEHPDDFTGARAWGEHVNEEWRLATEAEVRANLERLDGTAASAVSLLTGMPREELDEYGGVPDA